MLAVQVNVDWCRRSNPCQNGGRCRPKDGSFTCDCVGSWSGRYCDIPGVSCEMAALQRGISDGISDLYLLSFLQHGLVIHCQFCYVVGLQTDELCDHGGHCVNTVSTHYCKCPPDYTGSYCESQVDHCEDKPCLNGATCRGYVGGYMCDVSGLIKWCDCDTWTRMLEVSLADKVSFLVDETLCIPRTCTSLLQSWTN